MDIDRALEEFKEFIANQPIDAPDNLEELQRDFTDFARQQQPRRRRRAKAPASAEVLVELPPELESRQKEWVDAQLQRAEELVGLMLEDLGFAGTPFPDDERLADAFIEWAAEEVGRRGPGHTFFSIDSVQNRRLARVLRGLSPTVRLRSALLSEAEAQLLAYDSAIRRLVGECQSLSRSLGTDLNVAARWILAGIKPRSGCLEAKVLQQVRGPDTITMKLNANVVTAEEVRSIYRQLVRVASRPVDSKLRAFHSPGDVGRNRSLTERRSLWNERYPLHRYKNEESFRVATSRALNSRG